MEQNFQLNNKEQSAFEEFETETSFVDADKWGRIINHIVDSIAIYVLYIVFLLIFGVVMELVSPGSSANLDVESSNFKTLSYLSFFAVMVFYYTLFETISGKSLGKLITKTKVIDDDTNIKPTFTITFIRSLCRLIPFDAFSFFFYDAGGWHDRISKTRVVKI